MKICKKVLMVTALFSLVFGFNLSNTFAAGPAVVNLGSASNFVILAKTGISTTGVTSIVGDIGLSPAAASYITGFALTLPAASSFSTSALVTGKIYASDYTAPTPSNMTTAVSDMQTAYTDGMSRAANTTELGAGNIGGMTLAPGVYKWGTGLTIPTSVTLSGGANDVWIFQIAQNLNLSSGTQIILSGGAQAGNIFWVVAGQTTLGTTSVFNGNILDQTAIVLNTGARLNGRALAQTAVTLDSNIVVMPPLAPTSGLTNLPIPSPVVTPVVSVTPVTTSTDTIVQGCSSGNKYNIQTGALCINAVAQVAIAGCDNRTFGFSIITGRSCVGNIVSAAATSGIYNFGSVTLSSGGQGSTVMDLQKFLNAKRFAGLVVDGKFGPMTAAAVRAWQADNGLVVDGLVGPKTRAEMNTQAN